MSKLLVSLLIIVLISPIPFSKGEISENSVPIHSIVSNLYIRFEKYNGPTLSNINYSFIFQFDFTIFNELSTPVGVTYNGESNPPVFIRYNFTRENSTELFGIRTVTEWVITKKTNSGNTTTSYSWNIDIFKYDKTIIPDGNFTLIPNSLQFGEQLEKFVPNNIEVDRITMSAIVINSSISYVQDDLKLCDCPNFFENLVSSTALTYLFGYTFILEFVAILILFKRRVLRY